MPLIKLLHQNPWQSFYCLYSFAFSRMLVRIIYEACPEGIQPCTMKNKDIYWRRCNIQETVHRTMMPLSPSKQTPWHLTQFFQSPSSTPSYFPESHRWSEISSLSKVILVWGKVRSCRAPNLGYKGVGCWVTWVIWHFTKKYAWCDAICNMWCMSGCIVMMKLPINSCP